MFILWVACIVATMIIADQKKFNLVGYFFLALFLGPIALMIVYFSKPRLITPLVVLKPQTPQEARQQLQEVKTSLNLLITRVEQIEASLDGEIKENPAVVESALSAQSSAAEAKMEPASAQSPPETMEFIFGKYWLNRIGVVFFVIGIGLFINYTFQYFSAWFKIAIGYVFGVLFLLWGQKMEKTPRYQKLAWGVLGGAWGIFYLVTYAMYYVPATKMITNPYLEFALLWGVTICAVQYNLKYRSWVATAMCYFLGFVTIALAGLDVLSVVFWTMLLGSLAFLSCRFYWHELLTAGVMGAYWIYFAVLKNKIPAGYISIDDTGSFVIHLSLIAIAWVIFLGSHLVLQKDNTTTLKGHRQTAVLNTAAFVICGLLLLHEAHMKSRVVQFNFLMMVALGHCLAAFISRLTNSARSIVFHCVMAIGLFSAAVFLRYDQLSVTYWWMIQMTLMFALGIYYREVSYRSIGWLLGVGIILRYFWVDWQSHQMYSIGSLSMAHHLVVAILIAGVMFALGIVFNWPRIQERLNQDEKGLLLSSLPAFGVLVVSGWLWEHSSWRWLTLHLSVFGLAVLALGFLFQYRAMRWCALILFAICCLRIIALDLAGVDTIYKIIVVIFLGLAMLAVSMFYSRSKQNNK